MRERSKNLMKENGISFTPRLNKKSQSLERSVEDLMEWNKSKEMKTQILLRSKIKEQSSYLNNSVKLCPGTLKILERT